MPVKHLLFAAFGILFLFSCKKSSNSSSGSSSQKLKWYIEDVKISGQEQIDSFSVAYDNNNRITSLTSPSLALDYAYSSKDFTLDLYQNGVLSIHEIAYINGSSYVDSTFQFDNTSDTSTEGYYYNGAQLTRLVTYIYSSSGSQVETVDDYTYDSGGNMVKDTQTDGNGNVQQISTFTYTTKPYQVTVNPTYFSPASKYLPATQTQTDGQGNTTSAVTYAYTFDGSGRLTKETDTDPVNNLIATKTYVYE